MLSTILVALILGAVAPFVAAAVEPIRGSIVKRRAYRRLTGDPLVCVGVVFDRVVLEGRDEPLMGPCALVSLEVGRAEIRTLDGRTALPLTGRELEKIHPRVWLSSGEPRVLMGAEFARLMAGESLHDKAMGRVPEAAGS